jgi:hypothetical protein
MEVTRYGKEVKLAEHPEGFYVPFTIYKTVEQQRDALENTCKFFMQDKADLRAEISKIADVLNRYDPMKDIPNVGEKAVHCVGTLLAIKNAAEKKIKFIQKAIDFLQKHKPLVSDDRIEEYDATMAGLVFLLNEEIPLVPPEWFGTDPAAPGSERTIIKTYVHGSPETQHDAGRAAGLPDKAMRMFRHAADEFCLELDVDPEDGRVNRVLTIDGKRVEP